jgi:toluene monooxygenase system ferredoxin subunit
MAFAKAGLLEALSAGGMMACVVAGRKVLLVRDADAVHAYEDRCAHLGVPLSQGRLEGGVLTCGAHEWEYDGSTGCGVNPASARLRRFEVKVEGGEVWVDVA